MKVIFIIYAMFFMNFVKADVVEFNICQDQRTYPPFHFSEAQIKKTGKLGIVKTKLNAAAKGLKLKINYIKLPWRRCTLMFQRGLVDALLAAIWSKERQSWGVFPRDKNGALDSSRRILTARYSIFTHRDSKVTWDGKNISNITNGIFSPKGYAVTKILTDLGVSRRLFTDPTTILNVVARKRLDGFVSTNRVAAHLIKEKGLENQLKKLEIPILIDDWHIPVSHKFYGKNSKLVDLFWDHLGKLN